MAEVQERYDAAKPGALRQWWFDRRNKPEWATFWIAVVIFALTVFFGLSIVGHRYHAGVCGIPYQLVSGHNSDYSSNY